MRSAERAQTSSDMKEGRKASLRSNIRARSRSPLLAKEGLLEPTEGASVGEDVEEAQELAMYATRGADDAGQEG